MMLRTIAMMTAFVVLPQDMGAAKDLGVTGLALFLAIVLANVVTKLVDRRNGNGNAAIIARIDASLTALVTAQGTLNGMIETTLGKVEENRRAVVGQQVNVERAMDDLRTEIRIKRTA